MGASAAESRSSVSAPGPGRFHLGQVCCWLPLCAVLGCLAAWAVAAAQKYHSPFLLLSFMAGVLLGGALVGLLRVCQVGHRPTALLGAVLAGALAVGGPHYVVFVLAHENLAKNPKYYLGFPEKVPPDRFWEFIQWDASRGRAVWNWQIRGAWAWASWGAEGLLVLAPTILLVLSAARLPYCNRCRNWYHTAQSGRIDPEAARQLAATADVAVAGEVRRARYRLIRCPGGCGPTGLSLFWEESGGDYSACPIWLGSTERDRVQQLLDEAIASKQAQTGNDDHSTDQISLDPDP